MGVNVAVTALSASSVIAHVAVPEQAPLQPVKVKPAAGVAASDSCVPGA
jgi:hypothetical protein